MAVEYHEVEPISRQEASAILGGDDLVQIPAVFLDLRFMSRIARGLLKFTEEQ